MGFRHAGVGAQRGVVVEPRRGGIARLPQQIAEADVGGGIDWVMGQKLAVDRDGGPAVAACGEAGGGFVQRCRVGRRCGDGGEQLGRTQLTRQGKGWGRCAIPPKPPVML
jgi:hypothetical protein